MNLPAGGRFTTRHKSSVLRRPSDRTGPSSSALITLSPRSKTDGQTTDHTVLGCVVGPWGYQFRLAGQGTEDRRRSVEICRDSIPPRAADAAAAAVIINLPSEASAASPSGLVKFSRPKDIPFLIDDRPRVRNPCLF